MDVEEVINSQRQWYHHLVRRIDSQSMQIKFPFICFNQRTFNWISIQFDFGIGREIPTFFGRIASSSSDANITCKSSCASCSSGGITHLDWMKWKNDTIQSSHQKKNSFVIIIAMSALMRKSSSTRTIVPDIFYSCNFMYTRVHVKPVKLHQGNTDLHEVWDVYHW